MPADAGVHFLQIGERHLHGMGAGGDPRTGQRAMEDDLPGFFPGWKRRNWFAGRRAWAAEPARARPR